MNTADNFPHISRIFSARFLQQTTWTFLAIFFFIFLLTTNPPAVFDQSRLKTNSDYQNPQNHLNLAKEYSGVNNLENVRRELLIGLSFNSESAEVQKALGEVEGLISQPLLVKTEIEEWEKIARDFPGYRDAYLRLTQLHYIVYQNDKAGVNLQRAEKLDPNFEPTKEAQKVLRNDAIKNR